MEDLKEIQKNERKRMMEEAKRKKKDKSKSSNTLRRTRPLSENSTSAPGLRQLFIKDEDTRGDSASNGSEGEKKKKRLSSGFTRLKNELMAKKQPTPELGAPSFGLVGGTNGTSSPSPPSTATPSLSSSEGRRSPVSGLSSPRRKAYTLGSSEGGGGGGSGGGEFNNALFHSLFSPRQSKEKYPGKIKKQLSSEQLQEYERMKALFLAEALACETVSDSDSDDEVSASKPNGEAGSQKT